jgi:hypothetical protein
MLLENERGIQNSELNDVSKGRELEDIISCAVKAHISF